MYLSILSDSSEERNHSPSLYIFLLFLSNDVVSGLIHLPLNFKKTLTSKYNNLHQAFTTSITS